MKLAEYQDRHSKLQEAVQKIENHTKIKKLKKYTRDKKNYANKKIHRWQENITANTEVTQ